MIDLFNRKPIDEYAAADIPAPLLSFNIEIKLFYGLAGNSVKNCKTFHARDRDTAIAEAIREMTNKNGEGYRHCEVVFCNQVK